MDSTDKLLPKATKTPLPSETPPKEQPSVSISFSALFAASLGPGYILSD